MSVRFDEDNDDFKSNKFKGQHEKYKELEGVSKQIKRDIKQLFKRLRHVKKTMKKYAKCEQCFKYFIVEKQEINGDRYYECPYCGKKHFYI